MRSQKGTWSIVVGIALALSAAPSIASPGRSEATRDRSPVASGVIALNDSGINPYHDAFRDRSPRAYKHPSSYLPGYPKDARALRLTLDAVDYGQAMAADCMSVWDRVEPGKLYWIPGTRIVGAISFSEPTTQGICENPRILDTNGHGTMTASRAAGEGFGACPRCLIVSVQIVASLSTSDPSSDTESVVDALTWQSKNAGWIDAESNSWGPMTPGWIPTGEAGLVAASPQFVRAAEKASRSHSAFWASGNGAAWRAGLVGHPTVLAPHMTPSGILVGGHDSGQVVTWTGFSAHLVSDSCDSWGAWHDSTYSWTKDRGGGTSAASPFAAGGAVRILMDARALLGDERTGVRGKVVARGSAGGIRRGPLADGTFTLQEWKRVALATASERPRKQPEDGPACQPSNSYEWQTLPMKWTDMPDEYPEYVQIGYGAIDRQSRSLAAKVLRGSKALPDRSEADEYFELDRSLREAKHEVLSKP